MERKNGASQGVSCGGNSLATARRVKNPSHYPLLIDVRLNSQTGGNIGKGFMFEIGRFGLCLGVDAIKRLWGTDAAHDAGQLDHCPEWLD